MSAVSNAIEALAEYLGEEDDLEYFDADSETFPRNGDPITVDGPGMAEYSVFKDYDSAYRYAVEYVKEMLESEPELFSQDWLQGHYYLRPGDHRMLASDLAEGTGYDEEDPEAYEEMMYDHYYEELKDPWNYLKDDLGIDPTRYMIINTKEAAEEAVSTDGVGHFLAGYDHNEMDLNMGFVAFRTN